VIHEPRTRRLDELGAIIKLADGGQGTVHRAALAPGELYKEYHAPELLNVGELERLIRTVRDGSTHRSERDLILSGTAWPTSTVTANGACTGLMMPEAPEHFTAEIGGRKRLRELQFLIFKSKPMWSELALPSQDQRREIVLGFVRLFKALHDADIVIGDVSPRNFLWAFEPRLCVYALDCDGFRVNGFAPPMPQAQTPDWVDPDQAVGVATLDGDRYKLALLVLRVLLTEPRITPEAVVADPARMERLGSRVAELVERVAAGERCRADAWIRALGDRPTVCFDPVVPPRRRRPRSPGEPGRPTLRF
jgi:DNA-binding helix-hairpin-helix protein with protein kinase domain